MSYYGSNYPPSSGPPMPGGYGSAYNVNQYGGYGGAQGYGSGYGGGYGGGYSGGFQQQQQQQSGAVAGFTVPAVQHCQQSYGGGGGMAPMAPPASMQFNYAQQAMTQQSLQSMQMQMYKQMGIIEDDEEEREAENKRRRRRRRKKRMEEEEEDDEVDGEMQREMQEELERAKQKAQELQQKLEDNDSLKEEVRGRFIEELMRRQAVSGTFEETQGTMFPLDEYDEADPVAVWYSTKRDPCANITGEKWDGLYDSEYLEWAMDGCGTNEKAIIDVVVTRSNAQRHRILKEFKTSYGKDLIEALTSELGGNFKETVLGCFETPARYDAWAVKKAIYGLGTNEEALIEILMTRTNAQIQEMVSEYDKITYGKQRNPESSIERDVDGDTSGDFKRLLISATQGNRRLIDQESLDAAVEEVMVNGKWSGMFSVNYLKLCNHQKCKRMAEELFNAGEEKWGTDEKTFNRVFSTQDYYTLRVVWDEYVKLSQRDILNSVDRETSGNFKRGLCAIAQNIKCRPMYFAQRLYHAMKGLGTDDSTLIRIVVSRSEIDMVQIKQCFLETYKQTLWNFIKHDTSGDYRTILCAIVGKN